MRHNVVYKYFRLPYKTFWTLKNQENIIQLATGGTNDPVIQTNRDQLTRKAGSVWIRPYLIFARALKAHPDLMYLELTTTFSSLINKARAIIVIGYSWGDSHVNDLILDAVARGARLINVSKSALQRSALALWMHRFPTTYHMLRNRLFMFGGSAKRVLEEGIVDLPSGGSQELDFIDSINKGLPVELSLKETYIV